MASYEIGEVRALPGGGGEASGRGEDGREVVVWLGEEGSATPAPDRPALEEALARLGKLYHASLPRVEDAQAIDGRAALVVRAYRGASLSDRLRDGALEPLEALRIARGVAAGLVKAHRAGVAHGAIAPEEILLAEDGRVLLLHVGLAPFLGARPPRAPEDATTPGTPSGDVFALARVLLECLLGEDPHDREGFTPDEEGFPPALPQGLRRFLARAAHPDRDRRVSSAEEFSGDLAVILASWDSLGRRPRAALPLGASLRGAALAAAGALALAGAALAFRSCAP